MKMERKLLLTITSLMLGVYVSAQGVYDTVSIFTGYAHQSYYSLNAGEIANIDNSDWDIAFDASGYGSTIRINGAIGTELYKYPDGDTSDWATLDTAGISSWPMVYDSDTTWAGGAFNTGKTSNPMDLGWGIYSTITHHVLGDSLFVIKLNNGSMKKLQIESLASGSFNFKYANIDGTNEVNETVSKSSFSGRNFGYYSIRAGTEINREPASSSWDFVFTKYVTELFPGTHYGVTGLLSNVGVEVAKMSGVADVMNTTSFAGHSLSDDINTVGYDWKSYNSSTWSFNIEDSLCYFVDDVDGNLWRLVMTGFGGSMTGEFVFHKELISAADIEENQPLNITLYPNPADNIAHVVFNAQEASSIQITTLQGQTVHQENIEPLGLIDYVVDVSDYATGMYMVTVQRGSNIITKRIIVR